MYELEVLAMRDFINSLFPSQFTVYNNAYSVFNYTTKNDLDLKLKRNVIVSNYEGLREKYCLRTMSGVTNSNAKLSFFSTVLPYILMLSSLLLVQLMHN
jgi:hypothetical protein